MKCELSFFILQLYHRCLLKLSVGTHLVVKKCNHNLLTALLLQFQSVFIINCDLIKQQPHVYGEQFTKIGCVADSVCKKVKAGHCHQTTESCVDNKQHKSEAKNFGMAGKCQAPCSTSVFCQTPHWGPKYRKTLIILIFFKILVCSWRGNYS